jgi:hypothetical protein
VRSPISTWASSVLDGHPNHGHSPPERMSKMQTMEKKKMKKNNDHVARSLPSSSLRPSSSAKAVIAASARWPGTSI